MALRKIIAVFDTQEAAQSARDGLLESGLQREQVSITDQSTSGFSTETANGNRQGFWAHVKEMFMPDEDRAALDESLRRGGYVLTATVEDEQADAAIVYLDGAGAVDLEQRTAEWRAAGWQGAPATAPEANLSDTRETAERETIPVVEERLRVGKREVDRGGVRVRSYIVEEPVHEQVRLREERVDVERRPVGKPADTVASGPADELLQERTVELTETAEEAVVAKEAVVTEEVRLSKTSDERVEEIDDTVRRTKVEVDDSRASGPKVTPKGSPSRPRRGA